MQEGQKLQRINARLNSEYANKLETLKKELEGSTTDILLKAINALYAERFDLAKQMPTGNENHVFSEPAEYVTQAEQSFALDESKERTQGLSAEIVASDTGSILNIPAELNVSAGKVDIFKRGKELVIRPKAKTLAHAFKLMTSMPADFMSEAREDTPPQNRDTF